MKLNAKTSGTIESNLSESNSFTIAVNAKTFKVLSDTLYANKIGSIIRELSCNAFDSHIEAGTRDKQFEIHLPTVFEPWFMVKDYGVGMSHEFVMKHYRSYFTSTKDDSNKAVGAFGLGCKTPFSYTDTFSIVSVYRKKKRTYVAMIDETGVPAINLMSEDATTDHNGVEIRLNVKTDDIREFEKEIRRQLEFFPVKPVITNYNEFSWNEYEVLFTYGKLKVISFKNGNSGKKIKVGPVAYPVDLHILGNHLDSKEMQFINSFSSYLMDFDIGDIEVTPSRESISYSKHTINSIKEFIKEQSVILENEIKNQIAAFKTPWEKMAFVYSNSTFMHIASSLNLDFGKHFHRNGSLNIIDLKDYILDSSSKVLKRNFRLSSFYNNKRQYYCNDGSYDFGITPNDVFIIRDKASHAIARFREYNNSTDGRVYLIEHVDGTLKASDPAFIDMIKEAFLQCPNIIMASSLPEIPVEQRDYAGPPVAWVMPVNSKYIDYSMRNYERCFDEIEEIESGYYLFTEGYPTVSLHNVEAKGFDKLYFAMENRPLLYVFREKDRKAVEANSNLIEFNIAIENIQQETLQKIAGHENASKRYMLACAIINQIDRIFQSAPMDTLLMLKDKFKIKNVCVETLVRVRNICNKICVKYTDKIEKLTPAEKVMMQNLKEKVTVDNHKFITKIAKIDYNKIMMEKYPMMKRIHAYYVKQDLEYKKDVLDYINLVDQSMEVSSAKSQ